MTDILVRDCSGPTRMRCLENDLWNEVKASQPAAGDRDPNSLAGTLPARALVLFSSLSVRLPIFEVVNNTMDSFFCRRNRNGEERWWLEITGKRGKTRIVRATNELMVELARYRRELKLAPLPLPGETAPCSFRWGDDRRR